ELGIDEAKLNVNGGAIAIGHPLGATGVRLAVTLARELKRARLRYGIASACIGGGQGIALLLENPDAASARNHRPWTSQDTPPSGPAPPRAWAPRPRPISPAPARRSPASTSISTPRARWPRRSAARRCSATSPMPGRLRTRWRRRAAGTARRGF